MSDSFLKAVEERSREACFGSKDSSSTAAAKACDAAVAALSAGDAESALDAANDAIMLEPKLPIAWGLRSKALNELHLFADVLASVPCMSFIDETGEAWGAEGLRAQASLQALFQDMPGYMARSGSGDLEDRLAMWSELAEIDPTSLQARSAVYGDWVQKAARMREEEVLAMRSGDAASAKESHLAAKQALLVWRDCGRRTSVQGGRGVSASGPSTLLSSRGAPLADGSFSSPQAAALHDFLNVRRPTYRYRHMGLMAPRRR